MANTYIRFFRCWTNYDLYENLYASWTKIELPTKKNNIRSGEVQEVLWINYPLEETRSGQSNLFSAQLAI